MAEPTHPIKLNIIVPIYEGLEETINCLESVLASVPEWVLVTVINDCSPNKALVQWVRDYQTKKHFVLVENQRNLGFVVSVNNAMKQSPDCDVLLLNSDVVVPDSDWVERIVEQAAKARNVASISPFSNNATINSFPNLCEYNGLYAGQSVTQLDRLFAIQDSTPRLLEVPTAIGFCMYMSRRAIDVVGYFDEVNFGKGYGEENDWCQRAIKKGFKNYHLTNTFVFHKGGTSFGEEKQARLELALKKLSHLHPRYHLDVQQYIKGDPAKDVRLQAMIKLHQESLKPCVLLVAHGLGGGVIEHLHDLKRLCQDDVLFLTLQPIIDDNVKLSFSTPGTCRDALEFDTSTEFDALINLLEVCGVCQIHYHHSMALPSGIFTLPDKLACSYCVTIHDYYWLNGNPTLTYESGVFIGDDVSVEELDSKSSHSYPIPCTPQSWRYKWQSFLQGAEKVIFPSVDCYHRYSRFFALGNHVIAQHPDTEHCLTKAETILPHRDDNIIRVAVLGALSREKGAQVLEDVATAMLNQTLNGKSFEFHLLGYSYKTLNNVVEHGAYDSSELENIIINLNPDIIWFPALWPETYSYTLSTAMKFSMRIIAPAIGAFTERLQHRENTSLVKFNLSVAQYKAFFLTDDAELLASPQLTKSSELVSPGYYKKVYLKQLADQPQKTRTALCQYDFCLYHHNQAINLNKKEMVLKFLVLLTHRRPFSDIKDLVPYSFLLWLKNKLSKRNLEDIVR